MPLYTYTCQECERKTSAFRKVIDRGDCPACPACGEATTKSVDAPRVFADFAEYSCPITGEPVRGRQAHRENLAKHGCRIMEPGEKESFMRRKRQEEAQAEEAFAETAASVVANMPSDKRQQLETELCHGVDVAISRSNVSL